MAQRRPPLTVEQILAWADAYHERMGRWPTPASGRVREAAREDWADIDVALYAGYRGLPGGWTLPRLLAANSRGRASR
jgi:hypothetical protein